MPDNVDLNIHQDEDAELYVNSARVAELSGYVTACITRPLPDDTAKALRKGNNVMAIHCRNTIGGQYVDAGLVAIE